MNETVILRNKGARIKEYTIDYPNKFNSLEEAEKFANNLKRKVLDLCKKNKWHCYLYIGISEVDKKSCKIVKVKTNKKGRPKREYYKKNKDNDIEFKQPHIHIYMYGLPGYNLSVEIQKYLFKRSNCNFIEDIKVKVVKHKRQLEYIKKQSIKHRTVYRDIDSTLYCNNSKRLNYFDNNLDITEID